MEVNQYLEIFIEESKEHLQNMNTSLLALEQDLEESNLINEIFRSAHTLKGMAGTMGFNNMNTLTHDMENVLSEIRNGNIEVNEEILDILFQCLDKLEENVDFIIDNSVESDETNEALIDELNSILKKESGVKSSGGKAEEVKADDKDQKIDVGSGNKEKYSSIVLDEYEKTLIKKGKKGGFSVYGITIYIDKKCVLKSARTFILMKEIEDMGSVVKAVPTVRELEDEKFEFDFTVIILSENDKDIIKQKLNNISEVEEIFIGEIKVEDDEVLVKPKKEKTTSKSQKATAKKSSKDSKSKKPSRPVANRTVRVDIERLDTLMNLVSELIIVKNGLETAENSSKGDFHEKIEFLERITTNLHDAVMKVRMVPIERVFNRFPRLIRDLSKNLNKEIELHMSGEETELDRTVIDEIGDPLVHLIRNAGDHGLETPNERIKKGKDPVGNVYLNAYQNGNNVMIEVGEDGRGIDLDKVVRKAVEKGTITEERAETITKEEIVDLLFKPSFSTADKISDVSGRGVGLDVVKTKIESLGGSIEVITEKDIGSTFKIKLPLTLAIIQGLMVGIGDEKYAIPISTIRNIEQIDVSSIERVQSKDVIHLRGSVIPIVRPYEKLGLPEPEHKDMVTIVIVNKGEKPYGIVVDSLIGQQEIVIKSIGKYLSYVKVIAGATILGDGEVALILDVNHLV